MRSTHRLIFQPRTALCCDLHSKLSNLKLEHHREREGEWRVVFIIPKFCIAESDDCVQFGLSSGILTSQSVLVKRLHHSQCSHRKTPRAPSCESQVVKRILELTTLWTAACPSVRMSTQRCATLLINTAIRTTKGAPFVWISSWFVVNPVDSTCFTFGEADLCGGGIYRSLANFSLANFSLATSPD